MDSSISIVSVNCQGLNNKQKRRDVFHYLRNKQYSVYFLQDTHFEKKLENYILAEWGYDGYFSSYASNARGVAILFNNNFEFKVKRVCRLVGGNAIVVLAEIKTLDFLFVNIYGPNKDNPDFYMGLNEKIRELNIDKVIIGGDFNLVLNPQKDYLNYKHINNPKAKEAVDTMIDDLELNDIWRDLNEDYLRYTWRRSNPIQQARLDFFLISDNVVSFVENADIEYGYRTDHSMILLQLKFGQKIKTNTFWKFNSSLLKDKAYLDEINNEIKHIKQEYGASPYARDAIDTIPLVNLHLTVPDDVFLDFLLMKIRSKTIGYATMKKKKTNEEEKLLEKELKTLEQKQTKNEEDVQIIESKQDRLKEIRDKRMEGVLIRSRARWISEGEKITNYFCNLEKRHFVSKNMAKLIDKDDNVLHNQTDILKEVESFYKCLYEKTDVTACEIQGLVRELPRLDEDTGSSLDSEISLEEASLALKNMKNKKSPGTDGFTAEFFKCFWGKIGGFVVRALNCGFKKGELSSVQKQAIITCIPKGDKRRDYIKNWRPISLLNVVYKIGSSCIANRIKNVLPELINEDQTGFIRNRYIGDNIRLIYDTIAYLEKNNLPGLLLNVDMEKAFDSVDWQFLLKVLKAFGFQDGICRWVETFYKNIKTCVIVNGQISKWFKIERGCRQGDPLSPYLFILCMEILATMIREKEDIQGITINNVEHKTSLYADDMELLLGGDGRSFESCIHVIETFGSVSGLYMNYGKTSVIWLGSRKNSCVRYMKHLPLDWNPTKFKILGIWFSNDLQNIAEINYSDKLIEVKQLFKSWTRRQITPLGRVAVLKSLILSKLTYLWILLPNPPDIFFQTLQGLCYTFVWNKKPDKISRKVVHNSIENGGLGLPELKTFVTSLKLAWIRKLENTNHKWKGIVMFNIPLLGNNEKFGPDSPRFKKH